MKLTKFPVISPQTGAAYRVVVEPNVRIHSFLSPRHYVHLYVRRKCFGIPFWKHVYSDWYSVDIVSTYGLSWRELVARTVFAYERKVDETESPVREWAAWDGTIGEGEAK